MEHAGAGVQKASLAPFDIAAVFSRTKHSPQLTKEAALQKELEELRAINEQMKKEHREVGYELGEGFNWLRGYGQ